MRNLRRHLRQLQAYLDTAIEEMEAGEWPGGIVAALLDPARPASADTVAAIRAAAGEQAITMMWYEEVDGTARRRAVTLSYTHRWCLTGQNRPMRGCPLDRQRFLAAPNGLICMSLRTVEIDIAGHIAGLRRSGRRWLGGSGYAAGR